MLAVWKAGRLCVPLDGALPPARLEVILRDAEAGLVVADGAGAASRLRDAGLDAPGAADGRASISAPPSRRPRPSSPPTLSPASSTPPGSTGEPKGVVRTHRNLLHRARCAVASLAIEPDDRVSALHSPAFGAGLRDVLAALLGGAALLPFDLRQAGLAALRPTGSSASGSPCSARW